MKTLFRFSYNVGNVWQRLIKTVEYFLFFSSRKGHFFIPLQLICGKSNVSYAWLCIHRNMFGEMFHHKFVIYIYMFNKEMIHTTLIIFIVEIVEAVPGEAIGVILSPLAHLDRSPAIADPTSLVGQRKMKSRYTLSILRKMS